MQTVAISYNRVSESLNPLTYLDLKLVYRSSTFQHDSIFLIFLYGLSSSDKKLP